MGRRAGGRGGGALASPLLVMALVVLAPACGVIGSSARSPGEDAAPTTATPAAAPPITAPVAPATTGPGTTAAGPAVPPTVAATPSSAPVATTAGPGASAGGGGGQPVTNGPRTRRAVALTFDSNMTDHMLQELASGQVASFDNTAVIDELDQARVPATFFLAGKWMERYPDTTRRLAADPLFELGSHSYAHIGFAPGCYNLGTLPVSAMAADVDRSEQLLRSFDPNGTNLFRFPGGCFDQAALDAVAPTGVRVIQYDLPSGDAFGTSVNAIVGTVLGRARNGSIVVMHITGGNTAPLTDKALPAIISGLRAKGFELVTVTQLLDGTGPSR